MILPQAVVPLDLFLMSRKKVEIKCDLELAVFILVAATWLFLVVFRIFFQFFFQFFFFFRFFRLLGESHAYLTFWTEDKEETEGKLTSN